MLPNRAFVLGVLVCLWSGVSLAGPVVFVNDYDGFLAAAGSVQTIDFETLPDGTPSEAERLITPEFNYTSQGAFFSTPAGLLSISGNPISGFGLYASTYPTGLETWINADLVVPAFAVGIQFPGHTTLEVYGEDDVLLSSVTNASDASAPFLGVVSDVPIARAISDRSTWEEAIRSFHFTPIPEPGTALLLGGCAVLLLARRR